MFRGSSTRLFSAGFAAPEVAFKLLFNASAYIRAGGEDKDARTGKGCSEASGLRHRLRCSATPPRRVQAAAAAGGGCARRRARSLELRAFRVTLACATYHQHISPCCVHACASYHHTYIVLLQRHSEKHTCRLSSSLCPRGINILVVAAAESHALQRVILPRGCAVRRRGRSSGRVWRARAA